MEENREFVATPKQWRLFIEVLERPARLKPGLARLFSEQQRPDFATEETEGAE
jgi:uncharacterized protein (DUF1778 family)